MDSNLSLTLTEPELDQIPEETFPTHEPIGLTFAGGTHESDLLSYVERVQRLGGESC